MVNSANTVFKLTDMWNTTLFEFDSDWTPLNENIGSPVKYSDFDSSYEDLKRMECLGLTSKQITLQGRDITSKNMFKLSSVLCKQQLMKLWLGEDWFYYVLGIKPNIVRDVGYPLLKDYNVAFEAVDPSYYYSNSAEGSGSGKNFVVPRCSGFDNQNTGNISVDLTDTSDSEPTCDIQPVFWVTVTSQTMTSLVILDNKGRRLTYTPYSGHGVVGSVHVIMPYRNTTEKGFNPNRPCGFKLSKTSGLTLPSGTYGMGFGVEVGGSWALDALQHGSGTDDSETSTSNLLSYFSLDSGGLPIYGSINLDRSPTTYLKRWYNYPLALDGVNNTFGITVNGCYANVYAQWCWRRL